MSNLILPNLSFKSLDAKLPAARPDANGNSEFVGKNHKLGYKTYAYRWGDEICVVHHDTTIATLGLWTVHLSPHGYTSTTTMARLHKIMIDNDLWPSSYTVAIRNFEARIITPDDMKRGEPLPGHGALFTMVAGLWERTN